MAKQSVKVRVDADNKPLKKGLDQSGKQVEGFGGKVSKLGSRLKMLAGAAAIGAVVKGLFDMAKQVAENADRLLDLEQITGASTDKLQEFEHVARVAGVNSEFFGNAVKGLTQRLARGAEMSATLEQGINALGLKTHNAAGELRNMGDVTDEAITLLADMDDISRRNVIGAQLFSGAWKDLAPVLALGKDGIEAAKKEAQALGLVMSKEGLEAANEFRIEMETLNAQWAAAKRDITVLFMPAIRGVITALSEATTGFRTLADSMKVFNKDDTLSWYQKAWTWTKLLIGGTAGVQSATGDLIEAQLRASKVYEDSGQAAIDRAEAEKKAAEEAKARAIAEIEIENQRRDALGYLGRLEEDLATEKAKFTKSNSDAEAARHQLVISNLEQEIALFKELSKQGAVDIFLKSRGMEGMGETGMITPQIQLDLGDDEYTDRLKEIIELTIEGRTQTKLLGESMEEMGHLAYEAGMAMGNAFGRMASEGRDATQEIVRQMLAQVVAALIRHMAMSMGPAGAFLAGAAPGLAQAMFANIPAYASGVKGHPGGMALVGEQGPELVNLPGGSDVYSNSDTMGMMGGKVSFEIRGEKLYGVLQRYQGRLNHNV